MRVLNEVIAKLSGDRSSSRGPISTPINPPQRGALDKIAVSEKAKGFCDHLILYYIALLDFFRTRKAYLPFGLLSSPRFSESRRPIKNDTFPPSHSSFYGRVDRYLSISYRISNDIILIGYRRGK